MMLPQLECSPSATPFSVSPNKDLVTVRDSLTKAGNNWLPLTLGHQPDHASFSNKVWIANPYHYNGFGSGCCNLGFAMTASNNFWDITQNFLSTGDSGNARWSYGTGGDASNSTTQINYMDAFHIRVSQPTVPNNYVRTLVAHSSNALRMTSMAFIDLD